MYKLIFILMTLYIMTVLKANPILDHRLQNIVHSGNIIFTRAEIEALVNESQSYGTTCDSSQHPSTDRLPVYASSLCPWYYELSHQPGLFPSHILRAKLRCQNSGNESPCRRLGPRDYTCVYIQREIRLVNETCQGQSCDFIRNVRVGAQCVRTRSFLN